MRPLMTLGDTLRLIANTESMTPTAVDKDALEVAAAVLDKNLTRAPRIVVVSGDGADFLDHQLHALTEVCDEMRDAIGAVADRVENIQHDVRAERAKREASDG